MMQSILFFAFVGSKPKILLINNQNKRDSNPYRVLKFSCSSVLFELNLLQICDLLININICKYTSIEVSNI